jgi:hypothetical protein
MILTGECGACFETFDDLTEESDETELRLLVIFLSGDEERTANSGDLGV